MSQFNFKIRKGEDFSSTEYLNKITRNDKWKSGYDLTFSQLDPGGENYEYWNIISALTEDVTQDFYFKIDNFVSNIADVDTCELRQLASIAKSVGYTGNLSFLEYDYPQEIARLLNLFSINSNYVKNSAKIIQETISEDLTTRLSGNVIGSLSGYVDNDIHFDFDGISGKSVFSDDAWNSITELSSNQFLYRYLDQEKYFDYVQNTFIECISSFIYLKYRYSELYPNDTQYTTSSYIYEYTYEDLYENNLFKKLDSKFKEVLDLKTRLGLSPSLPVLDIANQIERGELKIENFSPQEQIVINEELRLRETLLNRAEPVSRFSINREIKVREYFQLIKRFNNSNYITKLDEYDIDSDLLILDSTVPEIDIGPGPLIRTATQNFPDSNIICEIDSASKTLKSLQQIEDYTYSVNDQYILKSGEFFRNLCLKISYFRESVKLLAKKNFLNGTPIAIRIFIHELFNKYLYDHENNWRYTSGSSNLIELSSPKTLNVIIKEYFDSTEYLNISSDIDYSGIVNSKYLNPQYWPTSVSELTGGDLTVEQIFSLYKHTLNSSYDSKTKLDLNSEEQKLEYLTKFISSVSDSAALSGYHTPTKSTYEYILKENSFFGAFVSPSTYIDENITIEFPWLQLVGEINYSDTYTTQPSGTYFGEIVSTFDLPSVELTLTTEVSSIVSTFSEVIELPPDQSNPDLSGIPPTLSTILVDAEISSLITGFISTDVLIPSGLLYYLSGNITNIEKYFNGIKYDDWKKLENDTIGLVDEFPLTISIFNGIYSDSLEDIEEGSGREIQGNLSTYSLTEKFLDNDGINFIKKYTTVENSINPFYNLKNSVHPTYALHPNIRNFVEKINTSIISFTNILEMFIDEQTDGEFLDYIETAFNFSGNTIDSWKKQNIDLAGYQNFHEKSGNLTMFGNEDIRVDIDGPWNISALKDFISDPSAFILSVSSETNPHYLDIGIQTEEFALIAESLSCISGSSAVSGETILTLKDKKIYQYCIDAYNNHYMLYKSTDEFDDYGEIWVRRHNHPLAMPFLYQINAIGYSDIHCAAINAYEFGINEDILWIQNKTNLNSKFNFAELIKIDNKIFARRFKVSEDVIELPSDEISVGVFTHENEISIISVNVDEDKLLPAAMKNGTAGFDINLISYIFNKEYKVKRFHVGNEFSYRQAFPRTYNSKRANVFKLTRSSEYIFAAYEYSRNLDLRPKNSVGKVSAALISELHDGYKITESYTNGIAVLKLGAIYSGSNIQKLEFKNYEALGQKIQYFEPGAETGYYPLFVNENDTGNEYQDIYGEFQNSRDIGVQTFMSAFPSDDENKKCMFEVYPELGKFKAWYEGSNEYGYEDGELQYTESGIQMTAEQFTSNPTQEKKLIISCHGGDNVYGDSNEFPQLINFPYVLEFNAVGDRRAISTLIAPYQYYDLTSNKYYRVRPSSSNKYRLRRQVRKLMNTYFVWDGLGKIRISYDVEEYTEDSYESSLKAIAPRLLY
jgi:hypothetical protein